VKGKYKKTRVAYGAWLKHPDNQTMPLADQIEMSVVRYLDRHPNTSLNC
jgi:hypothetical protein